jgi:hypothetical protein
VVLVTGVERGAVNADDAADVAFPDIQIMGVTAGISAGSSTQRLALST